VAGKGILTSEAVGAAATEGDDGGNGSKVQEEAPSSVPELHTSAMDIRPGLANDGKQGNVHSLTVAEVIHVIRGGGWSSGPMMTKPRTKEVRISYAEEITKWQSRIVVIWRRAGGSAHLVEGEKYLQPSPPFIGEGEREGRGGSRKSASYAGVEPDRYRVALFQAQPLAMVFYIF
jgi:hypothetical protein